MKVHSSTGVELVWKKIKIMKNMTIKSSKPIIKSDGDDGESFFFWREKKKQEEARKRSRERKSKSEEESKRTSEGKSE